MASSISTLVAVRVPNDLLARIDEACEPSLLCSIRHIFYGGRSAVIIKALMDFFAHRDRAAKVRRLRRERTAARRASSAPAATHSLTSGGL